MRVSRVFQDQQLAVGIELSLQPDAAHYLTRVLRLKVNDPVAVFNNDDGEFTARVSAISRNSVSLQLLEAVENHADPVVDVHLGLGLSRGERFDYAIQKSTELGVSQVTPLFCEFCEVKLKGERLEKKLAHWQKVAISASEQCGRSRVPAIHPPQSLHDWLAAQRGGLMLDASGDEALAATLPSEQINLLVGPEGGWSQAELEAAINCGYRIVRLGPRILRTETAPVAILTLVQYLYGDLG